MYIFYTRKQRILVRGDDANKIRMRFYLHTDYLTLTTHQHILICIFVTRLQESSNGLFVATTINADVNIVFFRQYGATYHSARLWLRCTKTSLLGLVM